MKIFIAFVSAVLVCAPLAAQSLLAEQQSARAAGVAGAFVAQVDDPSAIFYNPGALGLLKKKKGATVGTAEVRTNQVLFQGTAPGIAAGTTGQQKTPLVTLPYAFVTVPLGKRIVSGVGLYMPYRAQSDWAAPGAYAGRFLATRSRIEATDLATTFGVRIAPFLGVGGGVIVRSSSLAAARHLALAGTASDIATLDLRTDTVRARGWHAGLQLRPNAKLSIGATVRSAIRANYRGSGTLTQISTGDAQVDQAVAAALPFGQELALASALEFPAERSAGIAFAPAPSLLFEVDGTRSEWRNLSTLAFTFPNNPSLDTLYPLALKSSTAIRGGLRFQFPTGPQLRFGYAVVRTPQPEQTVGAFFADANRNTVTAGFGLDWLDLAVAWSSYAKRSVATSVDALNGDYRANGWSVTLSVTK